MKRAENHRGVVTRPAPSEAAQLAVAPCLGSALAIFQPVDWSDWSDASEQLIVLPFIPCFIFLRDAYPPSTGRFSG